MQVRAHWLHRNNELLGATASALADALAAAGGGAEAAQQAAASLDVLSWTYPPGSTVRKGMRQSFAVLPCTCSGTMWTLILDGG